MFRFLKLFTELPIEQINDMANSWHGAQLNEAKIILANEATKLLHGQESINSIHKAKTGLTLNCESEITNSQQLVNDPSINTIKVAFQSSTDSKSLSSIVFEAKLSSSKNEAKQFIKSGAVKINDVKCTDIFKNIDIQSYGQEFILSVGKRKFVRIQFEVLSV